MREYIVSNSLNLIKKNNPDYDDEKMEILEYGLSGLYIFISKSIIIFSISYLLGIFWELLIFMLFYNAIRLFSFGMHATSSKGCLIGSAISFILASFLSKYLVIPFIVRAVLGFIGVTLVFIYSPADTEKKPIINPKWRLFYKIISVLISVIMVVCSLLIKNSFIDNALVLSLLIQCFMISPLSYKLTNQKYNNYKDYQ